MSTNTPQSPSGNDSADHGARASHTATSFPPPSQPTGHKMSDSGHSEGSQIGERTREVQERIEEGFVEMTQRYGDIREQLRDYNERAVHFIRENPALCLAGAVGIGYVVGKLASKRWLT